MTNPGAIVSAHTGILACSFPVFHEYAEELLGRPVFTHEFADHTVVEALKVASKTDFLKLVAEWEGVKLD